MPPKTRLARALNAAAATRNTEHSLDELIETLMRGVTEAVSKAFRDLPGDRTEDVIAIVENMERRLNTAMLRALEQLASSQTEPMVESQLAVVIDKLEELGAGSARPIEWVFTHSYDARGRPVETHATPVFETVDGA